MGRSCPDNALGNAYRCSSKRGVVAVEVSVRNVLHSLVHLNTGLPAGGTVCGTDGTLRKCSLAEGSLSLEAVFEGVSLSLLLAPALIPGSC